MGDQQHMFDDDEPSTRVNVKELSLSALTRALAEAKRKLFASDKLSHNATLELDRFISDAEKELKSRT
jgi:hypothetical protein